ncbi:MAG: 6-phosphogluconolactonase [Bryobacteraceae bacterium]|nr:6-phosphogluconolactonase [Bryobacteraceae bacterium]
MKHLSPGSAQAAEACARHIALTARAAVERQGRASIALSGGSTVKVLFPVLAAAALPWEHVHWFWVDERGVPPTHEQSNYRLAAELLLRPAGIPAANVHRIPAEHPPDEAARLYAEDIRRHFALGPAALPRFDLIHLGMGPDAHTASLFPGEPLIEDRTGLTAPVWVPKFNQWRVTLLPGVIVSAHAIAFLATGPDKAEALRAVLEEPYQPLLYPAQIGVHGGVEPDWFLDSGAARLLR